MAYHSGTAGVLMVVLRYSRYSVLVFMDTLSIAFSSCHIIHYFQNIGSERVFRSLRKESANMSAVDQLVTYIRNLTPEQMNKVVNQLPRLISVFGEPKPPVLLKENEQSL